jgi:putative membrane protein
MKTALALIVVVLALAVGAVLGQQASEGQVDQPFVQAAAEGDLYELTSSQLAQQQSSSEAVQTFAQRMIDDHTMTAERLTELAESIGIPLPTMPGAAQQVMIAQLRQRQGAEFDRAYAQQQVLAHQVAVSLFETAAATAQDEQVRTFAQEALPALQEHLTMAQEMAQQAGDQ